jgi:hypothetical protein
VTEEPAPFPEQLYRKAVAELVRRLLEEPEAEVPGRCRPEDLQRVLSEYPASLVPLPPEAFEHVWICAIPAEPATWAVEQWLWSVEEGRSDLQLRMTVRLDGPDELHIEVDDLLVP